MVHILESWEEFEDYARNLKNGAYQIRKTADGEEIRVAAGRYGFIKEFKVKEDGEFEDKELHNRILNFCKYQGFKKVIKEIPTEQFFV